jgi:2'-5' RNA ligase
MATKVAPGTHGIVSLLDDEHREKVEALWADLDGRFGLRGIYVTPYPHFSYQVSTVYDLEHLTPILERFALQSREFRVRTAGLGIFTGPHPVLYVPVVRNPELTQYHQSLWQVVAQAAGGIVAHYHPARWLPHITLAHGDLDLEILAGVLRYLGERSFNWQIAIDNLTLIYDSGVPHTLMRQFEFGKDTSQDPSVGQKSESAV